PAYTHYLGGQLLRHLDQVDAVTRAAVLASPRPATIRQPELWESVTVAGDHPSLRPADIRHAPRAGSVALVDTQTSPVRACPIHAWWLAMIVVCRSSVEGLLPSFCPHRAALPGPGRPRRGGVS